MLQTLQSVGQVSLSINVFGYTAYLPTSENSKYAEIGRAIIELRNKHKDRFWIRQSGSDNHTMTALTYSNNNAQQQLANKTAFICPQQTKKSKRFWMGDFQPKKAKNCASCGLCWTTTKNVVFLDH